MLDSQAQVIDKQERPEVCALGKLPVQRWFASNLLDAFGRRRLQRPARTHVDIC